MVWGVFRRLFGGGAEHPAEDSVTVTPDSAETAPPAAPVSVPSFPVRVADIFQIHAIPQTSVGEPLKAIFIFDINGSIYDENAFANNQFDSRKVNPVFFNTALQVLSRGGHVMAFSGGHGYQNIVLDSIVRELEAESGQQIGFIPKPFDNEQIANDIRTMLGRPDCGDKEILDGYTVCVVDDQAGPRETIQFLSKMWGAKAAQCFHPKDVAAFKACLTDLGLVVNQPKAPDSRASHPGSSL